MPKTFSEIRDELKSLRDEIYMSGEGVDAKLVASYVDRLVMSLEGLTEALEEMEASVDCACECCESCGMPAPANRRRRSGRAPPPMRTSASCPEKEMADSYTRNVWTHKALMKKLAENGGNVPANLMD